MVDICYCINGGISNKVEMFLIALCVFKKKNYLKYVTQVTLRSVTHANWHTNIGSNSKLVKSCYKPYQCHPLVARNQKKVSLPYL